MAWREQASFGEVRVGKFLDLRPTKTGVTLGAKSAGILGGAGTNGTPQSTSLAGKNFLDFRTKTTDATGADSRGIYWRHALAGAGASGEAGRFLTSLAGASAVGVHGVHATAQIETTGAVAGQIGALRATLGAASATRNLGGTLASLIVDSDIGTNNTVTGRASLIRLTKSGSVDIANFLDVADDQCLKGDATVNASANNALNVIMPDGSARWILLYPAA
jgi:hypothetical protein